MIAENPTNHDIFVDFHISRQTVHVPALRVETIFLVLFVFFVYERSARITYVQTRVASQKTNKIKYKNDFLRKIFNQPILKVFFTVVRGKNTTFYQKLLKKQFHIIFIEGER